MMARTVIAGLALVLLMIGAAWWGLIDLSRAWGSLTGSAIGIETPDLDDIAMIRRGATHYDRFCADCHASPDEPNRADALVLTPPAPKLHLRVDTLPPELLFYNVKRGVPRSAMPAWPAEGRDDEIWAMVAFLERLPELDAAAYRELAGTEPQVAGAPPEAALCIRCHGADGRGSSDGAFPRLDIQSPDYLFDALIAFRDGQRGSGFMQTAVTSLDDAQLRALAQYFGRNVSEDGGVAHIPEGLPNCAGCHGAPDPVRSQFPRLHGQYAAYLENQLALFVSEEHHRGGGRFVSLMQHVAGKIDEKQIEDLVRAYAAEAE